MRRLPVDRFTLETLRVRARSMRSAPTPSESLLWLALRRQALGVRFRRQVPIGPFVVDFFCLEVSLVVEVDGGSHRGHELRDAARDRVLAALGLRVLRLDADAVVRDLPRAVVEVARALHAA